MNTIKQMEEFLKGLRAAGASDDTEINVITKSGTVKRIDDLQYNVMGSPAIILK